jgi:hypothetical protein
MEAIDESIVQILVFKTSLELASDISRIAVLLDGDTRISKWNVDREDVDHVLRIETYDLAPSDITEMLMAAGFYCEELLD